MMPEQQAVCNEPINLGAVLPPEIGENHRVTWRVNEIVSVKQIEEITSVAKKIYGVISFRRVEDQQVTPHTMFMMEVSSRYNQEEVAEVVDEFYGKINEAYLAEQTAARRRALMPSFSSR
jgi:acetolactate synthase small subunit